MDATQYMKLCCPCPRHEWLARIVTQLVVPGINLEAKESFLHKLSGNRSAICSEYCALLGITRWLPKEAVPHTDVRVLMEKANSEVKALSRIKARQIWR